MFYRMYSPLLENGFAVGFFHADVEGGNNVVSNVVFAAYVDAAFQFVVVDGETGYFVHFVLGFKGFCFFATSVPIYIRCGVQFGVSAPASAAQSVRRSAKAAAKA